MRRGRQRNSPPPEADPGAAPAPQGSDLPAPIVVPCQADAGDLLGREWLLANKIGAYASSTVIGANTRRYHGLLVAATRPPAGRIVALSCLMDQLVLTNAAGEERAFDLTTFEFVGKFSPDCRPSLVEFRNDLAATFVYRCDDAEVIKEIILAETANAVAVRYRLIRPEKARLRIWPFLALRDQHGLRRLRLSGQITYLHYHDEIRVEDRPATPPGTAPPDRQAEASERAGSPARPSETGGAGSGDTAAHAVHLAVAAAPPGTATPGQVQRARFHDNPQWWYRFRYRGDLARGQEGLEDLYTPGWFDAELTPQRPVQLTASLTDPKGVHFDATVDQKRRRLTQIVDALGDGADESTRRLAVASDAFVVARKRPNAHPGTTIVAGYHWFADWGRDAMIALPGLLLETGRHDAALQVLRTFAEAIDEGMVPNRFDEHGGRPHYNSIDASLWFVVAADRYVAATGDEAAWGNDLAGPVERILQAYHDGTSFGIRADADGLLAGGDKDTQLTWMDVKLAGEPVTPRHGKCVEVNALWHAALRIAARRRGEGERGKFYADLAGRVAAAFAAAFWNEQAGCLYDCVNGEVKDASIRPNQILAVALPHCPLPPEQQRGVVATVRGELLTPYGLRTLSPKDRRYRGHYGISWESRDLAYHQGTVWPWLMGPFVEAHLKVEGFSSRARAEAGGWLQALDEHLAQAGVGFISEIFDGDPPHAPAGCIAQAWSVAEVLRAKRLIARGTPES